MVKNENITMAYLLILIPANIFQWSVPVNLLEVHVGPGGDSAWGLDSDWLGSGAIPLPGQSSHLTDIKY